MVSQLNVQATYNGRPVALELEEVPGERIAIKQAVYLDTLVPVYLLSAEIFYLSHKLGLNEEYENESSI